MISTSVQQKLKISKRIVGRDREIDILQELYSTIYNSEGLATKRSSVYVRGVSGVGKSALIRTALKERAENDGGYFCEGKFDQFRSHRPFSAITDSLKQLFAKVLSRHKHNLQPVQSKIRSVISPEDLSVLTILLPSLEIILSDNENSEPDTISATSSNRSGAFQTKQNFLKVKAAICSLIDSIVQLDEMLVLFIDDLQWVNIDTLEIIQAIIQSTSIRIMFIAGYRSNEVDADHLLAVHIREQKSASVISIQGLNPEDITQLIAVSIQREEADVVPLAELVYEKTQGNAFYAREYLGWLYRNGHLFYSLETFRWDWEDVTTIQATCVMDTDVEKVVSHKIMTLPTESANALKLASCLGSRFDISVINYVVHKWRDQQQEETKNEGVVPEEKPIEEVLWPAVEEGLLEEIAMGPFAQSLTYKFTHDKVQSAAYYLIGKGRKNYHLQVGRFLVDLFESQSGQSWMLIVGADHLYKGEALISNQEDRDEMGRVCLQAAEELARRSAFQSAVVFARNAIHLIGNDAWRRDYNLALGVYTFSADMELCMGNQEECDSSAMAVIQHARSVVDKSAAQFIIMENLGTHRLILEAYKAGIAFLREMKVDHIPKRINKFHMLVEVLQVLPKVKRMSDEELINAPRTDDKQVESFTKIVIQTMIYAFYCNKKESFVFLALRSMRLSLKRGYTKESALAVCVCGMVCGTLGHFDDAKRLGQITLKVMDRFEAAEVDTYTLFCYDVMIYYLDHKVRTLGKELLRARALGLSSGNVGGACANATLVIYLSFLEGSVRIDKLIALSRTYIEECVTFRKEVLLPTLRLYRQVLLNLAGKSRQASVLQGDEIGDIESFRTTLDPASCRYYQAAGMTLAALFNDWDRARAFAKSNLKTDFDDRPAYFTIVNRFWRCIVWTSLYFQTRAAKMKRRAKNELNYLRWMMKKGVENAPLFVDMLDADMAARIYNSPPGLVRDAYDEATNKAMAFGYEHFAATLQERAGEYFYMLKETDIATRYLTRSVASFRKWRALGKVKDIECRYPLVFQASHLEDISNNLTSSEFASPQNY